MENPFFQREVRALARRPLSLILGFLVLCAGMGGFVLLWVILRARFGVDSPPWWPRFNAFFLGLVVTTHAFVCAAAGYGGGDLLFGAEYRRGTLAGVHLLPDRPGLRLLLQVHFPLYRLLLAWTAGAPIYLLAGALGLHRAPLLPAWSLVPLAAGIAVFAMVAMLPPDAANRMRRAHSPGKNRLDAADRDLLLRGLLCWMWLVFALAELLTDALSRPLRWLGTPLPVPGWALLAVAAAGLAAASVVTARATAGGEEARIRGAASVRTFGLGLLYYLVLLRALFQNAPPPPLWVQVVALGGYPVLLALLRYLAREQREDPWADQEIRLARALRDNPVFHKDFLVFTRFAAARSSMIWTALLLGGFVAVQAFLAVRNGTGVQGFADTTAYVTVLAAAIFLLSVGSRAYAVWNKERVTGTLPLLFLTRLSSQEILVGRLLAGSIYSGITAISVLLGGIAGGVWFAHRSGPVVTAAGLSLVPVLPLFILALGSMVRPQRDPPWRWPREDWQEAGLALAQVLSLFGCGGIAGMGIANRDDWFYYVAAALLFLWNAAIVWICFRIRVGVLDRLRRGDLELIEK